MIRLATSIAALAALTATAVAEPVAYEFDKSHANLSFSYNHLGYSTTEGRFGEWDGTLVIDQETPANSSDRVHHRHRQPRHLLGGPRQAFPEP
jgi:polyisoprenoid-binding protein YceI